MSRKHLEFCQITWLAATCLAVHAIAPCRAGAEPLWQRLIPRPRVEADPTADYGLVETNGPWLIMAATFSGEGAEDQARDLLLEIRSEHNLAAYLHQMTFDLASSAPMRGWDRYGRPRRAKFRRGSEVNEIAVLVGDYPSIEDDEAQRTLATIKSLKPKSLCGEQLERTTQNLAGLRAAQDLFVQKSGIGQRKRAGPMSRAFLTRNPTLPKGYFVPRGVDNFVASMNRGVTNSLLDCPGRHTVKVATFRGRTTLQTASSMRRKRKKTRNGGDPLIVAANNAHALTIGLRTKGWEAYEFHDRQESIVTIGSFDQAAARSPDGRVVPVRDVQIIIRTFGAAYQTTFTDIPDPNLKRRSQEIKQQFNAAFSQGNGQAAGGLHPKTFVGIPLDIHPHVIDVPRRSISSAYVRN